ncbi:MAG: hypothetical protein RMM17_13280 [Acidobacteriota bacterium]|nr:hypothetical protein [Blastocatellia bacterium]MDW8413640.1 hypothetical protein [Acidobacteriota bacterium]
MFETALPKLDSGQDSRKYILIAVIAVLTLIVLIGLYGAFSSHKEAPKAPGLPNAKRAGSPEFDAYAKDVAITNKEFFYAQNLLGGNQITAKGRLQNMGNKTIRGVEVKAYAVGFDGKVLIERLAVPIPKMRSEPLRPYETLPITVVINNAPDEGIVQDIKLELSGLILE